MGQLLLTLLWGLVVLGSFVTLGRLLTRALDPTLLGDASLAAGLGMAGMIFIGGLLNLAHLATSGVLMALTMALIALEGPVSYWNLGRQAPSEPVASEVAACAGDRGFAAVAAIGLLLVTVALRYVLSLGYPIHKTDDLTFYLPQIVKLLQTGSLGVEPYLFRQMQSLNGHTFLSALGCCVAPPEYAHLVDPGICWIMLGGLIYAFLRRDLGMPVSLSCLLVTISLFARIQQTNLGGQLAGPVLMATAVRLMFTGITASTAPTLGRLVLVGLVLGSLSSLKSTNILYAGVFFAFWTLLAPRRKIFATATQAFPVVLLIGLFMSPWMIQQYLSSGTLLYPILGQGHAFTNHGFPFELHEENLLKRFKFLVAYVMNGAVFPPLLALIAAALYFSRSPTALSRALLAASASGVVGSLLIGFMVAGSGATYRYTSTMLYVMCALRACSGSRSQPAETAADWHLRAAFFMALGYHWQDEKLFLLRVLGREFRGQRRRSLPTTMRRPIPPMPQKSGMSSR